MKTAPFFYLKLCLRAIVQQAKDMIQLKYSSIERSFNLRKEENDV